MTDPHEYHWSETLRNGLAVTIRELRAEDREKDCDGGSGARPGVGLHAPLQLPDGAYGGGARPHHARRIRPAMSSSGHDRRRAHDETVIASGRCVGLGDGRAASALRRWPSSSRRTTRDRALPRASCGTSSRLPAFGASRRSKRTCSRRTSRCSPVFCAIRIADAEAPRRRQRARDAFTGRRRGADAHAVVGAACGAMTRPGRKVG